MSTAAVDTTANGEHEVKPTEVIAEPATTTTESAAAESTALALAEAVAPTARRSTRISSQPVREPVKRASKNAKKRSADDAAEEGGEEGAKNGGASKKTKTVVPDIPSISLGDPLPDLTLKNEKDEDVDVSKLAVEKGVVLFLVPKADTPGCTTQACGFRDVYSEFTALGYDVYCLSADTTNAQNKWQTKKNLGYSLLSDPKRVFIAALGAADKNKTKRSHYIFEKGTGKLVDSKNPVKPADSPALALEFIKQHSPSGSDSAPEADAEATTESVPAPAPVEAAVEATASAGDTMATETPANTTEPTPMET